MDLLSDNVRMIMIVVSLDDQVIYESSIEHSWTLEDVRRYMLACYDVRDFKFCIGDRIVRP